MVLNRIAQGVVNDNGDARALRLDQDTHALKTVDQSTSAKHDGNGYMLVYSNTIGDGGTIEIRIEAPDTPKLMNLTLFAGFTGETTFELFEGTTKTHAAGNVLTPFNRDRNSSNTSSSIICHTPGGSGDGQLLIELLAGYDTGAGGNRQVSGSHAGGASWLILKQSTAYLLKVTSGTVDNRISVMLDLVETEDIE